MPIFSAANFFYHNFVQTKGEMRFAVWLSWFQFETIVGETIWDIWMGFYYAFVSGGKGSKIASQ